MDSAMRSGEIQPAGDLGPRFADPNGPRPRARELPPSHFSRARVNVGWDWVLRVPGR